MKEKSCTVTDITGRLLRRKASDAGEAVFFFLPHGHIEDWW